ncbi:hypothetical protein [Pseudomonas fluorescens]|uniref:hypothetical protein n=1 Tax=Pseudomonas fluorescens TaxID=294 RepID=UPI001BE6016D|nr:hypothetical protein [Pseudomonas fluorescens]
MITFTPGSMSLLLISCVLISTAAFAAGDGIIVIQRTVQGHMAGRSPGIDPNPTTVSANPSVQVLRATSGELSDNDIAGVASGSSITHAILPNGNLPGMNTIQAASTSGLGGSAIGHSGGGSSMAGQINGSIQRGMTPLNNISNMMGGQ